jgi:cbb3-type cytochrome oxidase maturation protein
MNVLTFLIPLALLIAGSAAAAFIWSVRSGQLDDLDTPPRRMIADDHVVTPDAGAPGQPRSYNEGALRH